MARRAAPVGFGLLLVLGVGAVVPFRLLVDQRDVGNPDAIVVLASHEWERLPAATAASRRWPNALVVLTVPSEVGPYNCADCGRRPAWLNYLGVDGERIIEVPLGDREGTWGEAQAVVAHAQRADWRRLLVVTSAFHTKRAMMTFKQAATGSRIEVGVMSAEGFSQLNPRRWWTSLEGWWYVTHESAAMVKYAWLGRLRA